jgi:hypothetical protein
MPPIKHVFVIWLENENYDSTFGKDTKAPYLAHDLSARGALLTQYYATGHLSLDNYITVVSGQPPNPYTQADAPFFADFQGSVGPDGVAIGQGSVYPPEVKTIADQLEAKGMTWKGYMDDMKTPCRHPAVGSQDTTQNAKVGDQYATRHNPFMYFHSIIDRPTCAHNDVPLDRLPGDLASASTTANYNFITPDLCNDGHDSPCVDGRPGGLVSANEFLKAWVPKILASPAFKESGLLVISFDEAEGTPGSGDADSCCGQPMGPNTPNNGGPVPGSGGGRIGAVAISRYIRPGTTATTGYNHYSFLRTTEDIFGVPHLAYAGQDGLQSFGADVFTAPNGDGLAAASGPPKIVIRKVPKRCVRHDFEAKVTIKAAHLRRAQAFVDRKRIVRGRRKSFTVRVRVAGLRAGRHRLTVRASQKGTRSGRKTAPFRRC